MKNIKILRDIMCSSVPAIIFSICVLVCYILVSCNQATDPASNTTDIKETEYISHTIKTEALTDALSETAESIKRNETEKEGNITVPESTDENIQSLTPAVTDVDFSSVFTLFSQYSYEAEIELDYSFYCKGKNYYHVHIDVPDGIDFPYETDFFGEYDGIKQTYFPYSIKISDDFSEGVIYFYVTFSETEFDITPDYKDTKFVCSMAVINYRGYYFMMRNYEISDLYNYADEYIYNYEHRQNN